jgi:hypothetical protein
LPQRTHLPPRYPTSGTRSMLPFPTSQPLVPQAFSTLWPYCEPLISYHGSPRGGILLTALGYRRPPKMAPTGLSIMSTGKYSCISLFGDLSSLLASSGSYVDRDMYMRYKIGMAVGHTAVWPSYIRPDPADSFPPPRGGVHPPTECGSTSDASRDISSSSASLEVIQEGT